MALKHDNFYFTVVKKKYDKRELDKKKYIRRKNCYLIKDICMLITVYNSICMYPVAYIWANSNRS